MATSPRHGVIVGPLKESHPAWIVVGTLMLFLPAGEPCHYKIETRLQVSYVEQGGRRDVSSITPMHG